MAKLQTGLTDRWRIYERQKVRGIRYEQAVKECLVRILELRQVNVLFEIGRLFPQLKEYSLDLSILGVDSLRYKTNKSKGLTLGLGERSRFVQLRIT